MRSAGYEPGDEFRPRRSEATACAAAAVLIVREKKPRTQVQDSNRSLANTQQQWAVLPLLAEAIPIFDEFMCKRSSTFITSCLFSKSSLVRSVASTCLA